MYKYIFGPVPSRRLGRSLGIDLIPPKVCTFDCVYCECGATTLHTTERKEYVPVDGVIGELKGWFGENPDPDWITLSGSGEPTLNSRFGEVIRAAKELRPRVPVAVLTNGSLLRDPAVRRDLLDADRVIPSLDSATPEGLAAVDRPAPGISLDGYLEGLIAFRKEYQGELYLETLLLPGYNDSPEELDALGEAFRRIRPDRIQINTLDRPGVLPGLRPMSVYALKAVRERWGLPEVEIIAPAASRVNTAAYSRDTESAILATISRRPCTAADLADALGTHINEINKYLGNLEETGRILREEEGRGTFYRTSGEQ